MKAKVRARTMPKPKNDYFGEGEAKVWRKNQDALSARKGADFLLLAVSDGAGAYGALNGPFAQHLVNTLPLEPIIDFELFQKWFQATAKTFSDEQLAKTQAELGFNPWRLLRKKGSAATLTAVWLTLKSPHRIIWVAYGDSPLLIFNEQKDGVTLHQAIPSTDPAQYGYRADLLLTQAPPTEEVFQHGELNVTAGDTVILASDAIGENILMTYLTSLIYKVNLTEEEKTQVLSFLEFIENGAGRDLYPIAEAILAKGEIDFGKYLKTIMANLKKGETWSKFIAALHQEGLIVNDDSTAIALHVTKEG